jgi:hypothetical protein
MDNSRPQLDLGRDGHQVKIRGYRIELPQWVLTHFLVAAVHVTITSD